MEKLGNRRVTGTEQYYTPKPLALELSKYLVDLVDANRSFLEPAGGTGAFVDALLELGVKDIQAVDLHPKHRLVTQGDFLAFQPEGRNLVTISNPPFGRNNSLSVPFFNHAAEFSEYIGFLVPRSWRKWSVINRLHQSFHLVDDLNIQVNYVDESGSPFGERNDLRTCFQIWRRGEQSRGFFQVQDQKLIEKASPENADVAVRVFGFGCGRVYRDFPKNPNTTLMFLRVLHPKVFGVIEGLDYGRFINNTAYTQALTFPEINFLLNEKLFGDPMAGFEDRD